jgi:hypothetical protein
VVGGGGEGGRVIAHSSWYSPRFHALGMARHSAVEATSAGPDVGDRRISAHPYQSAELGRGVATDHRHTEPGCSADSLVLVLSAVCDLIPTCWRVYGRLFKIWP